MLPEIPVENREVVEESFQEFEDCLVDVVLIQAWIFRASRLVQSFSRSLAPSRALGSDLLTVYVESNARQAA